MCSKIFLLPLVSGLGCPRIWVLIFLCGPAPLLMRRAAAVADGVRDGVGAHADLHIRGQMVRHLLPPQVQVDHQPGQEGHHPHLDARSVIR